MIVQNAVICNKCNEYIFSATRHDFCECACGNIFVDGGQEYLRRGGRALEDGSYTDMSWSLSDCLYRDCAIAVQKAIDTRRNARGIANAVLRTLRKAESIVAEGECKVIAENKDLDEIMVVDGDGNMNRYKKVIDNGLE